jgi:hypothetical protein
VVVRNLKTTLETSGKDEIPPMPSIRVPKVVKNLRSATGSTLQSSVKIENTLQPSVKCENTLQTSVKVENTLQTSVNIENTLQPSVKVENTLQTSVKVENTLQTSGEDPPINELLNAEVLKVEPFGKDCLLFLYVENRRFEVKN